MFSNFMSKVKNFKCIMVRNRYSFYIDYRYTLAFVIAYVLKVLLDHAGKPINLFLATNEELMVTMLENCVVNQIVKNVYYFTGLEQWQVGFCHTCS